MTSVLIASTDADFYLLLSHILVEGGFTVTLASSVEEVVHFGTELSPTAILLDCRPGDTMALEACVRLKQDATVFGIATVALIGPGAEHLHIDLIKSGIDETFVRPMAPNKLIRFLKELSRRQSRASSNQDGELSLASSGIVINLRAHRAMHRGRELQLGPIEYRLLRHLVEHAGEVVSRQALIAAAWDEGRFVDVKTVNVHVGRLRRALGDGSGEIIRTVRSAGYLLEDAARDQPQRPNGDG